MKKKPIVYVTLFLSILVFICNANPPEKEGKNQESKLESLFIDLAVIDPNSVMSVIQNCRYGSIILKNVIPDRNYSIRILEEYKFPDKLELIINDLPAKKIFPSVRNECTSLESVYYDLHDYLTSDPSKVTEKELGSKRISLETELKTSKCTDESMKDQVKALLKGFDTPAYPADIQVTEGKTVKIIISRDDISWTFEITGREKGKWLFTYGFGFTSKYLECGTYYSKPESDTSNSYRITKAGKPKALDLSYIPAIFYSYFPYKDFGKAWNVSLTAGLGFDLSAPVIFVGAGFLFHYNVGLNIGMALQQQDVLKDQYSEGDVINTYLDKSQLHDPVYRPNLFISVNFRFGNNPFISARGAE